MQFLLPLIITGVGII